MNCACIDHDCIYIFPPPSHRIFGRWRRRRRQRSIISSEQTGTVGEGGGRGDPEHMTSGTTRKPRRSASSNVTFTTTPTRHRAQQSAVAGLDVLFALVVALVSGTLAFSLVRDELRPGRPCGLHASDARALFPRKLADDALSSNGYALRSTRVVVNITPAPSQGQSGKDADGVKTEHETVDMLTPVVVAATVVIRDGRITDVLHGDYDEDEFLGDGSIEIHDLGNLVVMPGLIDAHVHLNEPGRTHWEGFYTGTMAAAAGGVTSIVDMPLNSIPSTVDAASLTQKMAASYGKLMVDVGFWGGLIGQNAVEDEVKTLEELLDAGVLGLKAFMPSPGTEEFTNVTVAQIAAVAPLLAKRGMPMLVHAEAEGPVVASSRPGNPTRYQTYSATRPVEWERRAISSLLEAWGSASSRLHIVHLSDAISLGAIGEARRAGANVTVETAPHYLYFSEDDIPMGSTLHKCAPPIRTEENREALWEAVLDGSIDMIASDHSPAPPEEKEIDSGDFLKAWGGIASLQFGLPVTWTEGKSRGLGIAQLARLWSATPAQLAGLSKKGAIAPGMDADIVVWDPEEEFVLNDKHTVYHQHPQTPYRGSKLAGKVRATFVRGQLVFADGKHSTRSCGKLLLKSEMGI